MPLPSVHLCIVLVSLAFVSTAQAHGGGLDGYGCHHNRKAGGYHCHQGPQAGQAFSSQAEMKGGLTRGLQPYSAGVEAAQPREPTRNAKSKGSIEARLRQLDGLHAKGLVTDDEYAAKRRAILEDL